MTVKLHIGNIEVASRILVAPMSGVTDLPFRRVLQRYDPGYVVSEMVAGKELCEGNADTELRAAGAGEIDPLVIQLVGNDAGWMAAGCRKADELGAHIIDINMGCPARKVTTGLSGSALMRDLDLATRLIEATVTATDKPVTLKMRLGWDHDSLNAPELARRAEGLGVKMIAVHGRTRCQFYDGSADWEAVAPVCEVVSVPVIVNGDIDSADAAKTAMEQSGADAVMVGRSLVGRPWLLADIKHGLGESIGSSPAKPDISVDHYLDIIAHYPEGRGVRVARKHVQAYLETAKAPMALRSRLMRSTDPDEVADGLAEAFAMREAA